MRLSILKNDPGYDFELSNRCKVLVDGVDVTNRCQTADEEEGKAWCLKHDSEGKAFTDHSIGEVAKEVLSGKIEIIL